MNPFTSLLLWALHRSGYCGRVQCIIAVTLCVFLGGGGGVGGGGGAGEPSAARRSGVTCHLKKCRRHCTNVCC